MRQPLGSASLSSACWHGKLFCIVSPPLVLFSCVAADTAYLVSGIGAALVIVAVVAALVTRKQRARLQELEAALAGLATGNGPSEEELDQWSERQKTASTSFAAGFSPAHYYPGGRGAVRVWDLLR
eukprot:m.135737 g.135737  ORF g.135737 m.135737 type:complete len:126 (-) comp9893_c0_seq4:247-624(-)